MVESERRRPGPEDGVTLLEVLISMLILSLAVGLSSQFILSATKHHKVKAGYSHLLEFINQTHDKVLHLDKESPLFEKRTHLNPFPELTGLMEIKKWYLTWETNNLKQENAQITVITNENKQIKWKIFLNDVEEVNVD